MKITIPTKIFSEALNRVRVATQGKCTLPILSHVLLTAKDGELTISATDLEAYLSEAISAEIDTEGAVALPAARLLANLSEMMDAPNLILESDAKNVVTIKAGKKNARMIGLPADDMPPAVAVDDVQAIEFPAKSLTYRLRKVLRAVSVDDNRPNLCGVFFTEKDGLLNLVSCDGRRLILVKTDTPAPEGLKAIIATRTVSMICALVKDAAVSIRITESMIALGGERWKFQSKILESAYPNYLQVIPDRRECGVRVTVEREEFIQALRFAAVAAGDNSGSVLLTSGEHLSVRANTPDIGENEAPLVQRPENSALTIAFNPAWMKDAFECLEESTVTIETSEANGRSPMLFMESGILAVLAPNRIS